MKTDQETLRKQRFVADTFAFGDARRARIARERFEEAKREADEAIKRRDALGAKVYELDRKAEKSKARFEKLDREYKRATR